MWFLLEGKLQGVHVKVLRMRVGWVEERVGVGGAWVEEWGGVLEVS